MKSFSLWDLDLNCGVLGVKCFILSPTNQQQFINQKSVKILDTYIYKNLNTKTYFVSDKEAFNNIYSHSIY